MPIASDAAAIGASPKVARKGNSRRIKSAYRDATFRPLFQALEALEALKVGSGTSVTYHTPSHPHYPTLHLHAPSSPLPVSPDAPAYVPENLSDEEETRAARSWARFYVDTPRKHRTPADWRSLSDEARLEWFHHAMRSTGPVVGFTLHFDAETELQIRQAPKSADYLRRRITRLLQQALDRAPVLWFAFEESPAPERRLHVHGELQASPDELQAVRKALRRAGGEWAEVRQHQAHTKPGASVVWAFYSAKDAIWTRPLTGRFANLSRPINGDWYYATADLRSLADQLYTSRRDLVMALFITVKS